MLLSKYTVHFILNQTFVTEIIMYSQYVRQLDNVFILIYNSAASRNDWRFDKNHAGVVRL